MLKGECRKDKFLFTHESPEVFTKCFWQKKPAVVLIWITYRFLLSLYFFCVVVCLIFFRPEEGFVWYKNMLYIPPMTCFFEFLLFTSGFAITVARHVKEKKDPTLPPLDHMPWQYKAMWVLYNLSAANSMAVTVMFWLLIYRADVERDVMYVIAGKLLNTVLLIIDYLLCEVPFRLLHLYVPCIFPAVYAIFSVVYQFSGGTGNAGKATIYNIVDWRKPQKPVLFTMMYVSMCVFGHCGMCTLHFLKMWIKKSREEDQTN